MCMCDNICGKCAAWLYIAIGVVIIITAQYWSGYIWHVIGGLAVLMGIVQLVKPEGCGCNTKQKEAAPKGKKKK